MNDPTNGALAIGLAADIQEGIVAACNDLDRLRELLDDAFGALLRVLPADAAVPGADAQAAITAMQFHDLAAQSLAHTRQRLRNCADRLAHEAFGPDEDGESVIEAPSARANPVTCAEMEAGSVELFD